MTHLIFVTTLNPAHLFRRRLLYFHSSSSSSFCLAVHNKVTFSSYFSLFICSCSEWSEIANCASEVNFLLSGPLNPFCSAIRTGKHARTYREISFHYDDYFFYYYYWNIYIYTLPRQNRPKCGKRERFSVFDSMTVTWLRRCERNQLSNFFTSSFFYDPSPPYSCRFGTTKQTRTLQEMKAVLHFRWLISSRLRTATKVVLFFGLKVEPN